MHGAHGFLETLAIVLCVAAVTTVLFQRFKQPVVLGYLLAGMLIGPNVPRLPTVDTSTVQSLAELGVILLMFSLGIEFSLTKMLRVGPTVAFVTVVECSLMMWLGFTIGQLLGWSLLASIYAGAIIAISSTTVIVKAFHEQAVEGESKQLVYGILIFEDLVAIVLIALLPTLSFGASVKSVPIFHMLGRLAVLLVVLLVVGIIFVPRLIRAVVRLNRPETTVVASVGLAFGFALLAAALGYSPALGAFLAGALVAESGVEKNVERLVAPVRDIFVAIFFVSVGMLIDPAQMAANWGLVLVFLAVLVAGKVSAITVGAFLTGQSVQTSVRTSMSMAQIGEFSFIIAAIGKATGAADKRLYSVAVAVSTITVLLTPWLIRAAQPTAAWVDRKLPRPLQTFAALYASWVQQLKANAAHGEQAFIRGAIRWLIVDAVIVGAIIIGASIEMSRIVEFAASRFNISEHTTRVATVAVAALLTAPFWFGMVRVARYLGFELATRVFPATEKAHLDLAAAPRRLLIVTLQLAIVLLIGLPLIAITQPFLPPFRGAVVLLFVLFLLAAAFWRGAAHLQGHARAGAQALADTLSRQTLAGRQAGAAHSLEDANRILAGLGSPVAIEIRPNNPHVGRSLADIKLRGLTGATVLAIQRGETSVVVPSGGELLQAGDILAVAGTHDAVEAAKDLLTANK